AWGIQISLEQVESQRPGGWLNEETARTKAEKALISSQERAGEREEESHDHARRIASAQAVRSGGAGERVLCEKPLQPSQTPFNARRVFTNKMLNGRRLIPMGVPVVKEVCHLGQCGTEDWLDLNLLNLNLLSVFLALTVVVDRAGERDSSHPCTPLSTRPRFSRRSFCAHRYKSQLRSTRAAAGRHVFVTFPARRAVGNSSSSPSRRSDRARARTAVNAPTVSSSK